MPIQSGLTCDLRHGSGLVLTAVPPFTQAAKPNWYVFCSVVCCSQLPMLRLNTFSNEVDTNNMS